ncbi:GH25 family lysozyme [Baileyella intestinalis]|uniref:GH25 family lysozyme n=1 Tax=Baileyella intestinalis TaxID=2606709 RepID=UPI0022E8CAED|nr:GH25 family lysozyme [Baileyella intestinalis]
MAVNSKNKLISSFFIMSFVLCLCFIAGKTLAYGDDSSAGVDVSNQQISDGYMDESITQEIAYSETRQKDSQALQDGQDSLRQDQETIQDNSANRDDSLQVDSLEETKDGIIVENGEKYYYDNDVLQSNRWILLDGKWMYAGTDGKLYRNTVLVINGNTYGFNDAGIMQTGVFSVGGKEYLADDSGALISNHWTLDEKGWKYSGSEGQILTDQWIYYAGHWYYAKDDGYIYQNCLFEVNGNKYFAMTGGDIRQNGWILNDGRWYYANSGGDLVRNGWIFVNGLWYYAKDDCSIYQNCIFEVNGYKYYASSGGDIFQNRWILEDSKWYYANSGGNFARNQWVLSNGLWYYASEDSSIVQNDWIYVNNHWYYANSGGDISQGRWILKDNEWYYAKPAGDIYQDTLAYINGAYYCFDSSGKMLSGDFTWNGKHYLASESGAISNIVRGIDVSVFQGWINWAAVAQDNVRFAFIRAGGRFGVSGTIYDDSRFDENMRGATSNGISAGAYFFTQAVNEQEAVEEANYLISHVRPYNVSMPLVIDTEYLANGRHNNLTAQQRTNVIKAFCQTIANSGYTPMIYGSTSWLNNQLIMSQLAQYKVWVAQYYHRVTYGGSYTCWQNTSSAHVNGIQGNVDNDYWYNI